MTETITAKEIALLAGTDARTMRRFIRSNAKSDNPVIPPCGQGNRYSITPTDAKSLVAAFAAWDAKGASAPRSLEALQALISDDSDEAPEAE